jgi:hypothetical protein
MGKLRHLISNFLLITLLTTCALAQNLTQIRDTITNADGTPFNGTVVITWNGYSTTLTGSISPLSTSARIYTGALSVLLVPTTTAASGSYYQVVYSSSDGTVMWTETWQVPPSTTALTVAAVRVSSTAGSGSPTSTGTTGTGGTSGSGTSQYATLPIAINQVTNLSSTLAQINTALTSLNSTVNGLTSSSASLTSTVAYIDAEVPSGSINGTNTAFQLSQNPNPTGTLEVYLNGLLEARGVDYTLSGQTLTFAAASIPQSGDILQVFYRTIGVAVQLPAFADDEIPAGSINGTNAVFTLAFTPSPTLSLKLYKNGMLMRQTNDYTLSGSSITFVTAAVPQAGDSLFAYYRH